MEAAFAPRNGAHGWRQRSKSLRKWDSKISARDLHVHQTPAVFGASCTPCLRSLFAARRHAVFMSLARATKWVPMRCYQQSEVLLSISLNVCIAGVTFSTSLTKALTDLPRRRQMLPSWFSIIGACITLSLCECLLSTNATKWIGGGLLSHSAPSVGMLARAVLGMYCPRLESCRLRMTTQQVARH